MWKTSALSRDGSKAAAEHKGGVKNVVKRKYFVEC